MYVCCMHIYKPNLVSGRVLDDSDLANLEEFGAGICCDEDVGSFHNQGTARHIIFVQKQVPVVWCIYR